jgi:hypothetical protein
LNVGQLIKDFGKNLWDELKNVLSAVTNFLSNFFDVWTVTTDDIDAIIVDFHVIQGNIQAEVEKLQHLHKPNWKTRVISVPRAMEAMHEMVELIRDDLFSRAQDVLTPLHDLVLTFQAEKASLQNSLDKPTALARTASFLHAVETAISQVRQAMDAAKDVTELVADITDKLNGLELIFLQQGNPRIRITGTISARDGVNRQT